MPQLIDYNGKIAVSFGWSANWEQPEEVRLLLVGKAPAERYAHILGHAVEFTGDIGVIHADRRYVIDTTDKTEWTKIVETRPVKKPRGGRRKGLQYDWEWVNGRWVKKFL